jgi:hypothetical protein
MNTPSTQQSNNDHRRPRVGLLYLQGLAVYLKHRLLIWATPFFFY